MPKRLKYLILVATVLRVFVACVLEFGIDEAYYFLYALDLQWNYFDHPPAVAWLIRLFTLNLVLTDEFFVRLGAIVCAAIGTWLAYRLGTQLKNEQTGWFAAILYTTSLYTSLIAGTFIIPDSPQVVAWLGSLLIMHEILNVPADQQVPMRSWLKFGLLAGLTILCKVHGVFLWVSMSAYIAAFARSRLTDKGLYAAAGITAVVISPILLWNIQHDFVTYQFHSARVSGAWINPGYFLQAVFGQLLYNNPLNTALILFCLWRLKSQTFLSLDGQRFVLLNGLPIIGVVSFLALFNPMLPHWSGPGFMALTFLAAAWLDDRMTTTDDIRVKQVTEGSAAAVGALVILAVLVIEFYPGTFGSHDKHKFGDNDFTLDLHGWKKLSRDFEPWLKEQERTGRIPRDLPLVSYRWFPAAHVEYYVATPLKKPMVGVGTVMDLHQYYWLNDTRPALKKGESALCIIPSNYQVIMEASYYRHFTSAQLVNVFYSYRGGRMARYFTVYLLEDYKENDEAHSKKLKR